MPQSRVARDNALAAGIDRLAADWILARQAREVAVETDRDEFCTRAQSLFEQVGSDTLWRSTEWNLFDVFGRPRLEDAHTHVIAWLMNPANPHGLRDAFLRAFFEKAFGPPAPAGTLACRVTVKKRIPVGEVDIEVKGPRWRLVVENKIDCEEGQGQTGRYAAYYRRFAKAGEGFFPVFLSREGKRPESRYFVPMSYRDLRDVLDRVCESARPTPEAERFMRDLVQHILRDLES
jgi:PD-(D/E)XK nuclease superfamily